MTDQREEVLVYRPSTMTDEQAQAILDHVVEVLCDGEVTGE